MTDNSGENPNNEQKPEKKVGLWKRFTSLPLKTKFYMILSGVLAVFLIAVLVMVILTVESFRPESNVPCPNWYGFLMGTAIVLGAIGCQYAALRQGYYFDMVFDYVIFAVPFAFGGGMLYYGIFSGWNGVGLGVLGSQIGALVGLLATMLVYRCFFKKKPKVSLLQMLDLAVIFLLLGQVFGRIGCFMPEDQCCYGVAVDKEIFPFSYIVRADGLPHLANPLIEAMWCLIGFIPMLGLYMSRRKSFNGFYTSVYCIWYGVERLILEFFRDPSEKLQAGGGHGGGFGVSQVVSIIMIAFGIVWLSVYIIRALATKKKIMILVPREKLSEDYLDYKHTIYYRPHVDDEGHPIDYSAQGGDGTDGSERKE